MIDPLLMECLALRADDAQDWCAGRLVEFGYSVQRGASFVYGEGDLPCVLVAHTDTVWEDPPRTVYHDAARNVIWAGAGGLGADDRIGVYCVLRLLALGLRPSVLFPDEEESSGRGAKEAAEELLPNANVLIQLDRANADDAVTYQHRPTRGMRRWLRRHGWVRAEGTHTDIRTLMPAWDIAGVNLSVGYYGQHTAGEMADLNETEETIRRVRAMLADLPVKRWAFRPEKQRRTNVWHHSDFSAVNERDVDLALALDMEAERCDGCGDRATLAPSEYRMGRYCDDCRSVLEQLA